MRFEEIRKEIESVVEGIDDCLARMRETERKSSPEKWSEIAGMGKGRLEIVRSKLNALSRLLEKMEFQLREEGE